MSAKLYSALDMSNILPDDENFLELEAESQSNFRSGFPAGFKRVRKEAGKTQKEAADLLGVSFLSIQGWEQGRHTPEIYTIEKICNLFGCSIDYLFYRTNHRECDAQLVQEYTGLGENAVETLQAIKEDRQIMAVVNHILSYRPILKRLTTLFASEFWINGQIDPDTDGRIISAYTRRHEEKLALIDIVQEISQEMKDFYEKYEDDHDFSVQMAFRFLKESADESGVNLPNYVYRKLKEAMSNNIRFTDGQISTAVDFLQFCGYEDKMKRDGLNFDSFNHNGDDSDVLPF